MIVLNKMDAKIENRTKTCTKIGQAKHGIM